MKTSMFGVALVSLFALAGCGTTVRSLTAAEWLAPPGSGGSSPASAPPAVAPATPAGGAAATPAPAAAPGGGGGLQSQYYVTYWEGSCNGFTGCSRGDGHVKRCKVAADNTVTCVEEANATKALSPD